MMVKSNALQNFKDLPLERIIEVPPTSHSRRFNECDIIGNLDRDDKANVVSQQDKDGKNVDKDGADTNERGYLVDPESGNVINNYNKEKMFGKDDLDEKGEVPAPFNVEKHNFNPHLVRGDFGFDRNGKPIIQRYANVY
jgi:hypothetical protein